MQFTRQVLAAAAALTLAAGAAHADPLVLDEGFEVGATLTGWLAGNFSSPPGSTGWFQGDVGQFTAQAGSSDSYLAANFNNGVAGGTINDWLVTPDVELGRGGGVLSFWTRAVIDAGFSDNLTVRFSNTGSSLIDDYTDVLVNITGVSGDWTQYTASFGTSFGHGRVAFVYNGAADTANYLGLDSVSITAVPEPAGYGLVALALAGLALTTRRRQQRG